MHGSHALDEGETAMLLRELPNQHIEFATLELCTECIPMNAYCLTVKCKI